MWVVLSGRTGFSHAIDDSGENPGDNPGMHRSGPTTGYADRRDARLMDIVDLLPPRGIVANLRASNKKQALQEIARRAGTMTGIAERRIYDVLIERERLGSTGIGRGIAIPHGKLTELTQLYGMFARLERPIPFEAIDDHPVDLMFMLLAPADAGAEHLRALALVSRLLRDARVCQKLRGTDSADALYALLTDRTESNAA
jgi:nitrogen PTS system EIIA component